MSPKEKKAVKATIKSIYSTFHQCGLRASEITTADKARGLKVGQLCDDCTAMIDAHMHDLTAKDAA